MNLLIREAINNKQLIRFEYDQGVRIVEPYRYGRSVKGNKELLRAYQLQNSIRYVVEDWRLFDISKMRRLEVLPDRFQNIRTGFSFDDEALLKPYYAEIRK